MSNKTMFRWAALSVGTGGVTVGLMISGPVGWALVAFECFVAGLIVLLTFIPARQSDAK
ncbi:hypothetical protein J7I94_19370 [Streptomyces sp. ISL-12]|uniref:hypothetical protein n=1 Tax=Streptomyces sp. ISL-12 TaxID=2819177 RepID=UPI001BE873AA|nr:hypothetical protein [Streptomyces sp. ISL-12]MBT2412694.1 hypothetical protein [Streptomyces sp. ISL-12]